MPVICTGLPRCSVRPEDCPHAVPHAPYFTWLDDADWCWCTDPAPCATFARRVVGVGLKGSRCRCEVEEKKNEN